VVSFSCIFWPRGCILYRSPFASKGSTITAISDVFLTLTISYRDYGDTSIEIDNILQPLYQIDFLQKRSSLGLHCHFQKP
jgi:hypothetical protein